MNDMTPEDPQAIFNELCRNDFSAFLRKAWPWISGGETLLWNWHLDAIVHELDQVANGNNRRLLINLPPRNAKSKTTSVLWVAWALGRDPTLNFVCVSYSNELSGKLARDCLSVMQSPWYRALFPKTIISSRRSAAYDFETSAGGGRLATSVTGTLTGRGGDIIILDDVIKPEEANSDTARDAVNGWFKSTLSSRLNDKASGAIIFVMQRLHQYDLSGMLLGNGGWRLLSLAAIATEDAVVALTRGRSHHRKEGDILHPEREPLSALEELKASMGSYAFQAQYQQNPVPADGNLIKAEWLVYWSQKPDEELYGQIVQSWDTANKAGTNNDWSVCVTSRVYRNRAYVIDVFRARLEFLELKQAVIDLARKYDAKVLLIEDQASGQQLIQTLRAESPQGVPAPIPCRPELDKNHGLLVSVQ